MTISKSPQTPKKTSALKRSKKEGQLWSTPPSKHYNTFGPDPDEKIIPRDSPYRARTSIFSTVRNIPLVYDTMSGVVSTELKGTVHTKCDLPRMLERLFPENLLPITPSELLQDLANPDFKLRQVNLRNKKIIFIFAPVNDNVHDGFGDEVQASKFLQNLCDAIDVILKAKKISAQARRFWTGNFGSLPLGTNDIDINRKPDLLALSLSMRGEDGEVLGRPDWSSIDFAGERKKARYPWGEFMKEVHIPISTKVLCIYEGQPGRRLVPFPTYTGSEIRLSLYDRCVTLHSSPIDIHKEPELFLHLILGLMYSSDAQIGLDTTIVSKGGDKYVTVKGLEYQIVDITFQNLALQGRATTCWAVSRNGLLMAMKQVWRVQARRYSEVDNLKRANAASVPYVPTLIDWEDVVIDGRPDSCIANRGKWFDVHDRIRCRLLFKEYGVPLWFFLTRYELFNAILCCVYGHRGLALSAGLLHRDISISNMMLCHGSHPRKGLLIDLQYSAELDQEDKPKQAIFDDKTNIPPDTKSRSKGKKAKPANVSETKLNAEGEVSEVQPVEEKGHRTGTYAFISHDILLDAKAAHLIRHDMESIFYVLLFIAVMYFGPCDKQRTTKIPWFIGQWVLISNEDTLGVEKLAIISMSDSLFEIKVLSYVTPYFDCMKPMLRTLRRAIQRKTINHASVIRALKKVIRELPHEVPAPDESDTTKKSPIDRILERADFEDMDEVTKRFKERMGPTIGPRIDGVPIVSSPGGLQFSRIITLPEQIAASVNSHTGSSGSPLHVTGANAKASQDAQSKEAEDLAKVFAKMKVGGPSKDDSNV